MLDQRFLGRGLSVLLPKLFASESKSYHDSAHRCCPAQDPKRIAQHLACPFWVGNQQPEFCNWLSILQARNLTPSLLPPWVLLGMPQGWTGSWPPCHIAAKRCTGLRMNLLPWQELKHALRCRHGGERQHGVPAAPPQRLFVVPFSPRRPRHNAPILSPCWSSLAKPS